MTLLLVPLTYYSVIFFQEANDNRLINDAVQKQIETLDSAELVELKVSRAGEGLDIDLTLRTNKMLRYEQVVELQEAIVSDLGRPVALKVNQIFADHLDPLLPPTPTPTPTPTLTSTPGPSPTASNTPTPTATATATATATSTPTASATPTATSLPQEGNLISASLPLPRLYQEPGGPVIGYLYYGKPVWRLYATQVYGGLLWVQVRDEEGRVGWIPEIYLQFPTPTPTLTPEFTATP
jgi:hypothetical protein